MTGVFNADFAPFSAAVDGAVLKLRDIESGSAKVETSLNKVGNSFSGAKIIQDATLMAKVFDEAGGRAGFTEKELARMSATGGEAVAKLRALGQDVPAGIQRIADESRSATTAQGTLRDMVKDVALGFAAMFTARAAFNFVKHTIDEASALKDLSQQTRISVEELQILSGGMSEFGVDADELGKGLFKLSRGIAGGDDSVARGLHLMGMSLKDVEGLQGKELFLKIESGLAKLQGGLRDTAAAELFGGKLGAAMAGASEGIAGTIEKWQRLNTVASTESVDAMDTFGESIARANKNLSSIAANMIGPVAEGFNVVVAAAEKGAPKWDIFVAMLKDFASSNTATGASATHLATLLDDLNRKTEENRKATAGATDEHKAAVVVLTEQQQAVAFMAALEADAAAKLTGSQLANLAHLKEIGALNAQNAAGIGVNAAQFAQYTASIEAAKRAATELTAAQKEQDRAAMAALNGQIAGMKLLEAQTAKSYGFAEQIAMLLQLDGAEQSLYKSVYATIDSEKERMKIVEAAGAAHRAVADQKLLLEGKLAGVINANVIAELEALGRVNAAHGLRVDGTLKVVSAEETLARSLEELTKIQNEGKDVTQRWAEAWDIYNRAIATVDDSVKKLDASTINSNKSFRDTIDVSGKAAQTFQLMGGAAGATAGEMDKLSEATRRAYEAAGFITHLPISGILPTPGARAAGGPVTGGQSYIVGERGPEIFTPTTSGAIIPNSGGRGRAGGGGGNGGGSISVTVEAGAVVLNFPIMDNPTAKNQIAQLVGDALMARMKAVGLRMPSGA